MNKQQWAGLMMALLTMSAGANVDKLATYQRMRELAAEMQRLSAQDASGQRAEIAALQTQFQALQDELGGDDPTRSNEALAAPVPHPTRGASAPPTPPAGMTVTSATFSNASAQAIPLTPAVITSTITVSGAQPYLWDVDLQTFMTHTFPGDLDITLESPAGTIVTLTTDNAAGNDDVFNGTVWDDDANPAGQVPYAANDGLVTDHTYVNLNVASPLVPEEGLGAFRGENPNGTWTLTISDDLAGDGGNFASWNLTIHSLVAAPTTSSSAVSNNTALAIPSGPAVVTQTVVVSGLSGVIIDVNPVTTLTHTASDQLDVTLQSPAGTIVTLSTDNGGSQDNVFAGTSWRSDANPGGQVPYGNNSGLVTDRTYANLVVASPLVPEESLSAFVGEDPNGTWTLTISDDLALDAGSLDAFTLNITAGVAPCLAITCPANVSAFTDAGVCNAIVNYPAASGDPGCGTITCNQASGSAFNLGSNTVTCTSPAGPTCNFTVNVSDDEAPAVTCPASINTAATSAAGAIVTYATATATDNCSTPNVNCTPSSGSTFPINNNNATCTATDAANQSASCNFAVNVISTDLTLSKTSTSQGALSVGALAEFTLQVSNPAAIDATGVVVTDPLPANLSFVSASCGATVVGQNVTWNIGTVAANSSQSCTLTTTVVDAGPITNQAQITAATFDPNPLNNTASVRILGALISIPVLNGFGLFALIGMLLGIAWARRQTI